MVLRLGDTAPDFQAESTMGTIRFHEWLGDSWGVLFSHPKDFTPVCTTELGSMAKLKPQFDKMNVKILGLSVDPVESHTKWAGDIERTQGAPVNFPIIADPDKAIATLYDMMHPAHDATHTVRTVFIIDPKKTIRLMLVYPQSVGRNFDEILRVVESMQLSDKYSISTPANWHGGEDVIILPSINDETAKTKFPAGWDAKAPYLRMTKDPRGADELTQSPSRKT